jgi:membrane-bound acyltransferase YfiQ involved in biofilm formation
VERKEIVPELLLMRSAACLAVVLLHAIGMVLQYDPNLSAGTTQLLRTASTLLLASTPTFAFMSAFLIGYSKRPHRLGEVLWKRVKYLLCPFLFFGFFYALWGSYHWQFPFAERLMYNLLGGYHGYFVLIVMQFYIAHWLLEPLLVRIPPLHALAAAWAINCLYLMGLNFHWLQATSLGFNLDHLFPAWVFYYVLGFYAGRYREAFREMVRRRLAWGVTLLAVSAMGLLYLVLSGAMPDLSSQRFDVLVYATGVILVFFALAGRVQRVPALLNAINRSSFGIYMLHWFFLELFWRWTSHLLGLPSLIPILALWAASVACSMMVVFLVSSLKIGPFIVGQLGLDYRRRRRSGTPTKMGLSVQLGEKPKREIIGSRPGTILH